MANFLTGFFFLHFLLILDFYSAGPFTFFSLFGHLFVAVVQVELLFYFTLAKCIEFN